MLTKAEITLLVTNVMNAYIDDLETNFITGANTNPPKYGEGDDVFEMTQSSFYACIQLLSTPNRVTSFSCDDGVGAILDTLKNMCANPGLVSGFFKNHTDLSSEELDLTVREAIRNVLKPIISRSSVRNIDLYGNKQPVNWNKEVYFPRCSVIATAEEYNDPALILSFYSFKTEAIRSYIEIALMGKKFNITSQLTPWVEVRRNTQGQFYLILSLMPGFSDSACLSLLDAARGSKYGQATSVGTIQWVRDEVLNLPVEATLNNSLWGEVTAIRRIHAQHEAHQTLIAQSLAKQLPSIAARIGEYVKKDLERLNKPPTPTIHCSLAPL